MNIFEKRPLSLILCIGLCGFFLFTFESIVLRSILIILSFLPLIISRLFNFDNRRQFVSQAVCISLILSFLLSFFYFDCWFKAYEKFEGEVQIEGFVEDYSLTNSYTKRLTVKVKSINGRNARGYKFYAYASKSDADNIICGTEIKFNATLTGFSEESKSYNISKGINAYASDVNNIEIIGYKNKSIRSAILQYRNYLARYLIMLSDSESGAILGALLLGERDFLPNQIRLDFKRIGISHILALSGMHLAILSLGIGKILSALRIKKKTRLIIINLFIFVYMIITGMSVSVVRAGIMLILASTLFILGYSKDSLTSLSVAAFIICLFNPHAIFDISFRLSALSTLGIIALAEYSFIVKPMLKLPRMIKYVFMSILASIFAISATIFISTDSFGGFSIFAPIATLIFSIIVEIIMYLGCIMILLGWLLPIGRLLSLLCGVVSYMAEYFSSLEFVYTSSNFKIASIAIIIYSVLFYGFIIFKFKRKRLVLGILIFLFCAMLFIPTVASIKLDSEESITYSTESKGDEIIIKSKGEVCLINSSQYSKSLAYSSMEYLEKSNIVYLDKYYLTHYSWSLDEDFTTLLSSVLVEEIYLPEPRNEDEETILKLLYKAIEDYRTKIVLFSVDEAVIVGEYFINLIYSEPYGETSVNAFSISNGESVYTYISSGILSLEEEIDINNILNSSNYLIFGTHGKKYKDIIELDITNNNIQGVIINSDNLILTNNQTDEIPESDYNVYTETKEIIYLK